jgi:hypothetical protein
MRNAAVIVVAMLVFGCAGSRPSTAAVSVYQARASAAPSSRGMPEGCRSIGVLPAVELPDSERYGDNPYRRESRATGENGGNVLLAVSETLVDRPSTECPSSDRSPGCLRTGNSWYRISFESFSCSREALAKLAALPPEDSSGPLTLRLAPGPRVSASDLKARLVAMKAENVSDDVLLAYVRGQRLRSPLTAEEIVEWKKAGIPDPVIEAVVSRGR